MTPIPLFANFQPASRKLIYTADLAGTFVFAVEGALAAIVVGFDPIGVAVLAFATALGGGIIRDLLIGSTPPAAMRDWQYSAIVLLAACVTWALHPAGSGTSSWLLICLDAAGLSLFAVVGTEKSLDHGIHPVPAVFLGAVSGVGGGTLRDILLNQVPRVLNADIYATAALVAAAIVAIGRACGLPPRIIALVAAALCFGFRLVAVRYHWQLPKAL